MKISSMEEREGWSKKRRKDNSLIRHSSRDLGKRGRCRNRGNPGTSQRISKYSRFCSFSSLWRDEERPQYSSAIASFRTKMDSFNCKSCMQSNFPSKTKNVKYIVGFIFWIILFIIIRVVDKLPARHTEVFEADVTYSHSGAGSTVPYSTPFQRRLSSISLAYVLSYVIPCIITMVLVFVFRKNNKVDVRFVSFLLTLSSVGRCWSPLCYIRVLHRLWDLHQGPEGIDWSSPPLLLWLVWVWSQSLHSYVHRYPKNEETGLYGVYGQAIDLSKCQNVYLTMIREIL